jgi:hypothetical protein
MVAPMENIEAALSLLALQHNQLLPQRGILCFKSALGLEERGAQAFGWIGQPR